MFYLYIFLPADKTPLCRVQLAFAGFFLYITKKKNHTNQSPQVCTQVDLNNALLCITLHVSHLLSDRLFKKSGLKSYD